MVEILQNLKRQYSHTSDVGIAEAVAMKRHRPVALLLLSNCGATSGARRRFKLVHAMSAAGIDIDRRGACFPGNPSAPVSRKHFKDLHRILPFIGAYKFYLAFENSHHCRDYITEKLFINAFAAGSVPVVWGARRRDYAKLVPAHSCIFVDDFASVTALSGYLTYLAGNDTAYAEYFQWRKMDERDAFGYEQNTGMCQLCRLVNGINVDNLFLNNPLLSAVPLLGFPRKPRVVASLKEWVYGREEAECFA